MNEVEVDEKLLPAAPLNGVTAPVINMLSLGPKKNGEHNCYKLKSYGKYQLYMGAYKPITLNKLLSVLWDLGGKNKNKNRALTRRNFF